LAIGYWLLAIGCWLLAISYWLSASGSSFITFIASTAEERGDGNGFKSLRLFGFLTYDL
jgi:hypothetical protein